MRTPLLVTNVARAFLSVAFLLAIAAPLASDVRASDGVLEINQTCAVETGCFAGDTPGFPVTITTGGSYLITSNLDLSAEPPGTSAISSTAPGTRIDLGGFEAFGSTRCTGSGSTLACSPGPAGTGGISFAAAAMGSAVAHGTVRGFARGGIVSEALGLQVEDTTVAHNFDDGIAAVAGATVRDCTLIENGKDGVELAGGLVDEVTSIGNGIYGVELDGPGAIVRSTSSTGNGLGGFSLVSFSKFGRDNVSNGNGAADSCGGRFCSERKRFYVTGQFEIGTPPPIDTCDDGFRLLRYPELVGDHLAEYDGGGATPTTVNLAGIRYGASRGGTLGSNGFACDDEPGGIRCDSIQTFELTGGWQATPIPQATVFDPTICIEK